MAYTKEERRRYGRARYRKGARKAYDKAYRKANPDKLALWARNNKLKLAYGITINDYEMLLSAQQGRCAICRRPPSKEKVLHVDHDHQTGRIRALLCTGCNAGLGNFKENRLALANAIAYLDFYEEG